MSFAPNSAAEIARIPLALPIGQRMRLSKGDVETWVPRSRGCRMALSRVTFTFERPVGDEMATQIIGTDEWAVSGLCGLYVVARSSSGPIGFCAFDLAALPGDEETLPQLWLNLDLVYVRPETRGKGLATALAAALILFIETTLDQNPHFALNFFHFGLSAELFSEGGERFCGYMTDYVDLAYDRANDPYMRDEHTPRVASREVDAGW